MRRVPRREGIPGDTPAAREWRITRHDTKAKRDAGENQQRHQRQHDRAHHSQGAGTAGESCLDHSSLSSVVRPARSVRKEKRRILGRRAQDDASEGGAAAQRRRRADPFSGRARGAEQLQPRQGLRTSRSGITKRTCTRCDGGNRSATRRAPPCRREDREQRAPREVTRLWPVAVQVVGLDRTRRSASLDKVPPGAMPSNKRRASGSPDSIATTTMSRHSSA